MFIRFVGEKGGKKNISSWVIERRRAAINPSTFKRCFMILQITQQIIIPFHIEKILEVVISGVFHLNFGHYSSLLDYYHKKQDKELLQELAVYHTIFF